MSSITTSAGSCLLNAPCATARKDELQTALRHCSADTREAALRYRATGDTESLREVVAGIVGGFVPGGLADRAVLRDRNQRLAEDLAIDSLSLMEIGLVCEEVLLVTIDNEDLFRLRTLGDLEDLFQRLLRDRPAGGASPHAASTRQSGRSRS